VMIFVNRRSEDQSQRSSALLIAFLLALGGVGVGLMATSVLALAIFGWISRDVVREVLEPLTTAWANQQATSSVRATMISMQSQAMAVGEIFGGLALGYVAESLGLRTAFTIGAVILGLSALTMSRARHDGSSSAQLDQPAVD